MQRRGHRSVRARLPETLGWPDHILRPADRLNMGMAPGPAQGMKARPALSPKTTRTH